jgi:hypothetical protein
MFNTIIENIQAHLSLLELALQSTIRIKACAQIQDLDNVANETDNRERIINIVAQIQHKIEKQIDLLVATDLSEDSLPILKSWFQDLAHWSDKMTNIDTETVEILANQKDETTKEIVTIFKNKELFKGYNLSSKK